MAQIIDHPLAGSPIGISWGYTPLPYHSYYEVKRRLRDLLRHAEYHGWSWGQEDAIQWLIKPTLLELGYQDRDMHRTVRPIPGSKHRADMHIRNSFQDLCIVEAKKIDSDPAWPESYKSFHNPIDQGLRYFEPSGAARLIVTNGIDWYLFDRCHSPDIDYVAILFRLDLELSQYEHRFEDFIGLFHVGSITHPQGSPSLPCHCVLEVRHKTGPRASSSVLIHDATGGLGVRQERFRSMDYRDPFAPF